MPEKTNTERLGLIESRNDSLLYFMDDLGNGEVNVQSIYNDTTWLIEEAKRVIVLERDYKFGADQMTSLVKNHNKMDTENKRFREKINSAISELDYTLKSHKSQEVKNFYVENAKRILERALGGSDNG